MKGDFPPYEPAMTLQEIGEKLGITKQQVRGELARGLKKIERLVKTRPQYQDLVQYYSDTLAQNDDRIEHIPAAEWSQWRELVR